MADTVKYGYDFTWRNARVSAQWFDTKDECDACFMESLDAIGYYPPRWWEFWRWGEHLPGPYARRHAR